jgi:hypothetical protein
MSHLAWSADFDWALVSGEPEQMAEARVETGQRSHFINHRSQGLTISIVGRTACNGGNLLGDQFRESNRNQG